MIVEQIVTFAGQVLGEGIYRPAKES